MNDVTDADRFRRMAERIDHNQNSRFGGAAVIIPPMSAGAVQPIELLMLDAQGDPAQFLSTIMSRLQIMLREMEDNQRVRQGFGTR